MYRAIALLAVVIALCRVGITIGTFNDTVDEPYNVAAAIAMYGVGKHVAGTEQPPLTRLVAGLPLYLSGVRLPAKYHSTTVLSEPQTYLEGGDLLFHSSLSYEQILRRGRLAMLIFPALALFYLYLLGKWLAGEMTAMFAVIFFSTDPTLLGHAFWICTDVAACAGFLAATYHGLRWINRPTTGKSVAAAIAIALAISCKFSCVLVIPGLALAMIIRPLPILFDDDDQKWRNYFDSLPSMKQFAIMAVVGFVTLWATYLFNIGPLADQSAFNDQKEWQRLPAILKNTPIPMPSLPLGILRLLGHNRYGHSAYLNGQIRMHGWWYYFPEAIALKSPLALLVGIVIALILLFRLGKPRLWPAAGFILPPAIFLAAAMKGNLDIGIRHMLPIIPFLYLLVCTYLVRARWILWLMVLIGVCFMETAWVHPEYVSFFNLAAGGPSHGDRFLVDSNLDWGQDIALLSRWLHSDANKGISYSSRLFMYPVKPLDAALDIDPAAQTKPPIGIFIISQNVKTGATPTSTDNLEDRQSPGDFTWLEKFPIVKRIGYSILVYNVSEPSGPTATKIREDIRNTSQPQFSTGDTQDELRVK